MAGSGGVWGGLGAGGLSGAWDCGTQRSHSPKCLFQTFGGDGGSSTRGAQQTERETERKADTHT